MTYAGIYSQSTLKLVTTKENELTQLEKQLADFKESGIATSKFNEIKLDETTVKNIRNEILSALDVESPEEMKILLRNYIEKIKI